MNLINHNIYDPYAIGLSFIHDIVEDGFITPGIILALFGPRLYQWLLILSKKIPVFDEITGQVIVWAKRDLKEYFDGIANADPKVRLVKLSDRLDNLSTLNDWPIERIKKYINETSQFLIPIAQQTDQRFLNEIEKIIKKLKLYRKIK